MTMLQRYAGDTDIVVQIPRADLLARLATNRARHARHFERALAAWQTDLAQLLAALQPASCRRFPPELDRLKQDCPQSRLLEYDRAIDMFTLSVDATISLDAEAFNRYCRDEWDWQDDLQHNPYFSATGLTE